MRNIDQVVLRLQFFGKYPAMDITYVTAGVPWLGNYFPLVQEFLGGHNEKRHAIDGFDRTSCSSLFHSEMVLGKNEYL